MLTDRGADAERLLHEAVRLVTVAIRAVITFRALSLDSGRTWSTPAGTTTLSFHLSICQKAARDAAGAPRLSICPSAHTCLALVPDKDGPRADRRTLLFGQSSLYTGE